VAVRYVALSCLYLVLAVWVTLSWGPWPAAGAGSFGQWAFLLVAAIVLSVPVVRLERGIINLTAIATVATALTLNPTQAAAVGLAAGTATLAGRVRHPAGATQVTGFIVWTAVPTAFRLSLQAMGTPATPTTIGVVATVVGLNVLITGMNISFDNRESVVGVLRGIVTPTFIAAYLYFSLAAILLAHLLDGTLAGYGYGLIVGAMSLALTDTISVRRVRHFLEAQLTDSDRHLAFSRAVEGVVHNLRNHLASIIGYLGEVSNERIQPSAQKNVDIAMSAAYDAAEVLKRLSAGAAPRVVAAERPVDLNELISGSAALVERAARQGRVQLSLKRSVRPVLATADPLLLREVFTNLLLNALEAVGEGGAVVIETGVREDQCFVTVRDNGPGFPEESRDRLFEPHFTTKTNGVGIGLFTSYGIVREHHGQLLYEGSNRGAVFTVTLPGQIL